MRPKRIILLIDSNEFRASVTRFVLKVWRMKVVTFADALKAEKYAAVLKDEEYAYGIDGVLAYAPADLKAVDRIAQRRKIGSIVVVPSIVEVHLEYAQAVTEKHLTTDVLIARLKTLTAKRRGPSKGYEWWQRRQAMREAMDRKRVAA